MKRLFYRKERECSIGGGRHFKLLVKDRGIIVLIYYRLYITYTLLDFLFGLDQSNVYRDIEKIESLIRECLPVPQKLYKVTKRLKTREEIETYFPGFMTFTDCSEQPIPRPINKKKRRLYYNGKRKKHTVKNMYTTNRKGLITYKTKHKQIGKRHNYGIYKDNYPKIPNEVTTMYDLGFLGVEDDYPEQKSSLPIKKEKDCELTVHKRSTTTIILQRGSDRTCYFEIKEV